MVFLTENSKCETKCEKLTKTRAVFSFAQKRSTQNEEIRNWKFIKRFVRLMNADRRSIARRSHRQKKLAHLHFKPIEWLNWSPFQRLIGSMRCVNVFFDDTQHMEIESWNRRTEKTCQAVETLLATRRAATPFWACNLLHADESCANSIQPKIWFRRNFLIIFRLPPFHFDGVAFVQLFPSH